MALSEDQSLLLCIQMPVCPCCPWPLSNYHSCWRQVGFQPVSLSVAVAVGNFSSWWVCSVVGNQNMVGYYCPSCQWKKTKKNRGSPGGCGSTKFVPLISLLFVIRSVKSMVLIQKQTLRFFFDFFLTCQGTNCICLAPVLGSLLGSFNFPSWLISCLLGC